MSMAEWVIENVKPGSFWLWQRGGHKIGLRVVAYAANVPYDEERPYRIEASHIYHAALETWLPPEIIEDHFVQSHIFREAVERGELKLSSRQEIEALERPSPPPPKGRRGE